MAFAINIPVLVRDTCRLVATLYYANYAVDKELSYTGSTSWLMNMLRSRA